MGASASAIGAFAHVGAGGTAPPLGLLLLLGSGVTAGCAVASRWRWRMPSLVAVMLLAQLGFHLAFAGYAVPGAHAMHTAAAAHTQPEPAGPMAASHIVAALALALFLRFGEAWLRRVVEALDTRLLRIVSAAPAIPAGGSNNVIPAADTMVPLPAHAGNAWSRGPPQVV